MKRKLIWILIPLLVLVALLATGTKTNPPSERTVAWDSPDTEVLFNRACANCHSNNTVWPWYANVAPVSWLVIGHVNEGREHFNISAKKLGHADEAWEEVKEGDMPPWDYLLMHSEAKLTAEEKEKFITGLKNTFVESKDREKTEE
jgi:mono/diheme cytochrome c family protein